MKAFDSAYLRLTGWYVLIIMVISLMFSVWVHSQATREIRMSVDRIVQESPLVRVFPGRFQAVIEEHVQDSHRRLIVRLVSLNALVLAVGAIASYGLARRTLRPIEESVEAQHRFTADASHELRTPLAAMKAEIEVGLRDKKLTKNEAVGLLRSSLEEVDRLEHLAEGLLVLTQADAVRPLTPVSLEEIAAKVTRRLQALAEAKHIAVKRQLKPVIVPAEEAAVDKIISILLDNAIKYSPAHTEITLKTYQKDGHGFLKVEDHGIGIRSSELPHIFDRFYRADSSRSVASVAGHGLGLSIAKRLAESINATIDVKSGPGKGSEFTLRF